ncbi:MAG TPA: hypothetical protein VKH81_10355 [Candidatus Angelobacter sp.]|nr:hypothetical protein [Candidatus Angelobacter sp.]
MPTPQNEFPARLYAGLYLGTGLQRRFWGWTSHGWEKFTSPAVSRPVQTLAEWLRQAHAQLDGSNSVEACMPHPPEPDAHQLSRNHPRLQFVCNRQMIGLLIR